MVKFEDYVCEVRKMRSLQKRYFQTRSVNVLCAAKSQEKKVDDLTSELIFEQ